MQINLMPMLGRGVRFSQAGYILPKPLIEVSGRSMILRAIADLPPADRWVFLCSTEHVEQYDLGEILTRAIPESTIISIDHTTEGQASSCLYAETAVNSTDSLLIAACDNGMQWDRDAFAELQGDPEVDAIIVTFRGNPTVVRHPEMYGWARVDADNFVTGMSVKVPISADSLHDHAVVGTFWFRRAGDFFVNAKQMIAENFRINGEFYVDAVFDFLIASGLRVKVFEVDTYVCWGTPDDLRTYQYWERFHQLKHSYS